MAKQSYGIPASLDQSVLDHEIGFAGGGWSLKPTPIKQLVFISVGLGVTLWVCMNSWVKDSGPALITLVALWMAVVTFYLGKVLKTKELRATSLLALVSYAPKAARRVTTRRSSDPTQFFAVTGIDSIDEDGRISFTDGTVGQGYLVVGSASSLLFDEDKVATLNRVDSFWRKVETTCEYAFITTKEPQRIYHQVATLERRNQSLEVRDPDLLALQEEKYEHLTNFVGKRFTSIHQYLVLKGKNHEALRRAHTLLQAELEGSSLMIKDATMLDRDETYQLLQTFFQSIEGPMLSPLDS